MTSEQQYNSLVESLRLIASSADEQLATLPDFVSATDEIATTFGDAFLLLPQLREARKIAPAATEAIIELDDWFSSMPRDGSIIDAASLKSHSFWERARELAVEALRKLGEDRKNPNLEHISWVE